MKKSFIKDIKDNNRYNESLIDNLYISSIAWYGTTILLAPIIDAKLFLELFSISASLNIIYNKMETNNLIYNTLEGKSGNDKCYRLLPNNHLHKSTYVNYMREGE